MPGGKITINSDIPDLESFIARKRYPLDKWLLANNITSVEAFKSLIDSGKWVISESLVHAVEELLKPVSVPAKAFTPVVTVVPVVVAETKQEDEAQVVLNSEDSVISAIEEVVPQVVEEPLVVSFNSNKERKKTR